MKKERILYFSPAFGPLLDLLFPASSSPVLRLPLPPPPQMTLPEINFLNYTAPSLS